MIIFNDNRSTKFCRITSRIKNVLVKEKWFLFSAVRCTQRVLGICPAPVHLSPENHHSGHLPAVHTLTQARG